MKVFGKKITLYHIILGFVVAMFFGWISFQSNPIGSVMPFAIKHVGEIVYAGDTFEHTFTLTNGIIPLPDLDEDDGEVTRLYRAYRMLDQAGNKVQEGYDEIVDPISAGGSISYVISLPVEDTTPSGNYASSAILFKVTQSFNEATNTWSTGLPSIIDKQAIGFTVQTKTPVPTPDVSAVWTWLSNLFSSIFSWIKSLLGW